MRSAFNTSPTRERGNSNSRTEERLFDGKHWNSLAGAVIPLLALQFPCWRCNSLAGAAGLYGIRNFKDDASGCQKLNGAISKGGCVRTG